MKQFIRIMCLVLVVCTIATMPVYATSETGTRANAYIASHDVALEKTTAHKFRIWFDVTANAMQIDQIGATEIEVYRSPDQVNWTLMKTYSYIDYPEMMDYNTGTHAGYVTYGYTSAGYYYKAYVTLYAGNSAGGGSVMRYTAVLQM